ncbi:MAG: hypothetical protein ACI959_000258 [Limisphaerales bacterium]|jgi:hypothetical protein
MRTFTLLFVSLCIIYNTYGQLCEVEIVQETTHPCRGDIVVLSVHPGQAELEIPLDTLNGLRGIMFDVEVNKTINLTGVSVRPRDTTTIEAWYKVGTYNGWETASGVWTFIQSWSNVPDEASPVDLAFDAPITVPAGQTYGIYITSTDPSISIDYSRGDTVGAEAASDANIKILEGAGLEYPFGGPSSLVFESRRIYGSVFYSAIPDITWSTGSMATLINEIASTPKWISVTANFAELGCITTDSIRIFGFPEQVLPSYEYLCTDQSLTLNAGPGIGTGYTYLWTTGETGEFLTLEGADYSAGEYVITVEIDDGVGCTALDVITVAVEEPPFSALWNEVITVCIGELITLDPEIGGDYEFLWSDGSTDSVLVLPTADLSPSELTYTVLVNKGTGCELMDTVQLNLEECTGINYSELSLSFYPNPASTFLYIEGITSEITYEVSDLTGRIIQTGIINNEQIDIALIPNGMYFLKAEGYNAARFSVIK